MIINNIGISQGIKVGEYYYLNNNNVIILSEENFSDLKGQDFKKILLQIIDEIRLSNTDVYEKDLIIKFDVNDNALKTELFSIISDNIPLFGIFRLIAGDNLVNFSFGGIKSINDGYGDKGEIDICLYKIKKNIKDKVDLYISNMNSNSKKIRTIRENYKHLTLDHLLKISKANFLEFLGIGKMI